ncbi:MAG: DUF4340 domain-containing protein [Clostridia bacterium]|nr:DUF4340 domain-containing protein [Clostridia bacterium]
MNKKKIVILAISLIVLLGVLALVMALPDSDEPSIDSGNAQSQDYNEEAIYKVSVDSVTSVTVSHSGELYTLTRTPDGWICAEKSEVGVSQSRVTRLMTELCSVRYTDKLDTTKVTPADCGITDASDYVSFESSLGTLVITRGNDVANSDLCYVMTSLSDDIYMVKRERVSLMFAPFGQYRNDTIARIDFENITAIKYQGPKCSFSLTKGEYNLDSGDYYAWKMTSPIAVFARDNEIESKLILPIASMDTDGYVNDNGDFASYGLGDKSAFVTYTDAKGKTQTVYFSKLLNNQYYISIDDGKSIYAVSPSAAPFATLNLIDIADRQLYLTKQSTLSTITIDGAKKYKLEFRDDGTIAIDGKVSSSESASREIFSNVCGPLADDISTAPMGAIVLTMKFDLKDSTSVTLTFSDHDERYYAVARDGKPLYTILKSKLDTMFGVLDKYKD